MHEMGVEYTEAIAVLLMRISSRICDRDISDIAVDRPRQAVRDRGTALGHWSSHQELVHAAGGSGWLRSSGVERCTGGHERGETAVGRSNKTLRSQELDSSL